MIKTAEQLLERQPAGKVIALATTSLAVIAVVDFETRTELLFVLFYLIPIALIAWRFPKPWGFVAAFLCAAAWGFDELLDRGYADLLLGGWNFLIEFGLFSTFALFAGALRDDIVQLRILNNKLESALSEVKELSGLLPICAWCKRIRDDGGNWHPVEDFIRSHTDASFTHGICPDCSEKSFHGLGMKKQTQ